MKICGKATYIVAQCPSLGQSPQSKNLPCPHCGGTETRTGAGRKPQEASLHCRECKRFIKWISAGEIGRTIFGNSSQPKQQGGGR
jgi:hypothetical protein